MKAPTLATTEGEGREASLHDERARREARLRGRRQPWPHEPPVHCAWSSTLTGPHAHEVHEWTRREVLAQRAFGRWRVYARLAIWYLAIPFLALGAAVWCSGAIASRTGKGRLRQLAECLQLAYVHAVPPWYYWVFRLYEPEQAAQAGDYLFRYELKPYAFYLLRSYAGGSAEVFNNKQSFWKVCRANGLRAVPVLFSYRRGRRRSFATEELPDCDLIMKPKRGRGGQGVVRWNSLGDGRYGDSDGRTLDRDGLDAHLLASSKETTLVQPRLRNHPELHDLAGDVLTTVRILTCRTPDGGGEATNASLRIPVGQDVVDNIHQGGVAAAVDIASGRVGRGTALSPRSDWVDRHPVSDAPITGRVLPCWRDAIELVEHAHRIFPQSIAIGWDVALLEDGPCLVEANSGPCVDLIQRPLGAPIGNARFGELLAEQMRAIDAGTAVRMTGPGGS